MTPIGHVDKPKESCAGTRQTEICGVPRHVDASRIALLAICAFWSLCCTRPVLCCYDISSVRAAWGEGGALPDFFWSLFPVQQTTSGVGHHVGKVAFSEMAANTLNVRNNNNKATRHAEMRIIVILKSMVVEALSC